jgi:hypothetical protein
MLTFGQLISGTQDLIGDYSVDSLAGIKRNLNIANKKLNSLLRRYATRTSKTTDTVANQTYYQLPEDCVRVTGVVVIRDGKEYPLTEVADETMWRNINLTQYAMSDLPGLFFVRGLDEIGIYPATSDATEDGLEVYYEPRQPQLTKDDFESGTVTVAQGSQTITHSDAGFSQDMVGRYFQTTDGDGLWYKIGGFTSTSVLTLEQYYQGMSGSGRNFIIGEAPIIPEEYHESLMDYAAWRHYLGRKDRQTAADFQNLWVGAIEEMQENYGNKTSSMVLDDIPTMENTSIFQLPPNNIT